MKKGYIVFLVISLLLPIALSAQKPTIRERRNINTRVLDVIEAYERLATLSSEDDVYEFKALFVENATIKSDIIGNVSYLQKISVDDYIKHLRTTGAYTEIRDVRKFDLQYDTAKSKWIIPISFKKQLYYYDKFKVYFNIKRYYSEYLDVMMQLVYDATEDLCYIESIDCSIQSSVDFPKCKFLIVDENTSVRDRDRKYFNMLKADDKALVFDDKGYALYDADTDFSVDDIDVEVSKNLSLDRATEAYNFVDFKFMPRTRRAKFRMAFAPFAYAVSGNDNNVSAKSSAFDFGLDYGFTFRPRSKSKMGLYIGAGLSFSNLSLKLKHTLQYNYTISRVNKENGLYDKTVYDYNITNAIEKVRYVDLYIPIYFEMEHRLGANKRMLFTWNLGVKSYINLSAKASTPYTATFTVVGEEITQVFDSFIQPNTYAKNFFDLSLVANIGLDYKLLGNNLYATANIGYEYGIFNSYMSDKSTYSTPVIPIVNSDNSINHIAVNSLISGLSAKRNALWISLGVKYKF